MLELIMLQLIRVFGLGVTVLVLIAGCVFGVIGAAAVYFWALSYFWSLGL